MRVRWRHPAIKPREEIWRNALPPAGSCRGTVCSGLPFDLERTRFMKEDERPNSAISPQERERIHARPAKAKNCPM